MQTAKRTKMAVWTLVCVLFCGMVSVNGQDASPMVLTRSSPNSGICLLDVEKGGCAEELHRWFYNPEEGVCEQFVYTGCDGNANNFETRLECQRTCRAGCDFVNCFADPCQMVKCPAFPGADCVANFCTGCDADFFVDGKLVDCESVPCAPRGSECVNPEAMDVATETGDDLKQCCEGMMCCACGPPVESDDSVPEPFGECKARCNCLKG